MLHLLLLALCFATQLISSCKATCGQTPVPPGNIEIVGGKVAIPYSWPWQVVLCTYHSWFGTCGLLCGGSVISDQWIMSAGHCVSGHTEKPGKFRIKLGVFQQGDMNDNGEIVAEIDRIVLHPNYSASTQDRDISLIHLKSPISFTNHIQSVCLPSGSNINAISAGQNVTVTGWGVTFENGFPASKLHQVTVPVLSQQKCDYDYINQIDNEDMFCAGITGKDSCQGDSGGPVVQKDPSTGQWTQYGIVSWGTGCARANKPGVYSKVNAFRSWIKSLTGI